MLCLHLSLSCNSYCIDKVISQFLAPKEFVILPFFREKVGIFIFIWRLEASHKTILLVCLLHTVTRTVDILNILPCSFFIFTS